MDALRAFVSASWRGLKTFLFRVWLHIVIPISRQLKCFLLWWRAKTPGIFYSFWLHLLLILSLVGLPFSCQKDVPKVNVVTVDILPIKEVTNVKPKTKPKKKPKPNFKPKPKLRPKAPPPPETKPKPKPPVAKPKPKIEPKPKPKPKVEEKQDNFDKVLKSVEDIKKQVPKSQQQPESFDPSIPLSLSEIDAIKQQISECWSIPAGARGAEEIIVSLRISLARNGTVTQVDIIDKARYARASESFYKAAVDAAVRAVRQCSPLKRLPANKYNSWREIELHFDPKEMLY